MNFLHGGFYAFRIALVRQQRFGQFPICLTNRRDQFIPAPSELSFNRFQLVFLFGAKTQLAVNPVMIVHRSCRRTGARSNLRKKMRTQRQPRIAPQKAEDDPGSSRLLIQAGQTQRRGVLGKDLQVQRMGNEAGPRLHSDRTTPVRHPMQQLRPRKQRRSARARRRRPTDRRGIQARRLAPEPNLSPHTRPPDCLEAAESDAKRIPSVAYRVHSSLPSLTHETLENPLRFSFLAKTT